MTNHRSRRKIFSRKHSGPTKVYPKPSGGAGCFSRRLSSSFESHFQGKKEDIAEAICIGGDIDFKTYSKRESRKWHKTPGAKT